MVSKTETVAPRNPVADGPGRSRIGVFAALLRLVQIQLAIAGACGVYFRERLRLRGRGAESRPRAAGRALLHFCNRLGATFIKLGQILSTRADLLPQPLLDELAAIQDQVPSFPFDRVRRTIEAELGKPLDEVYESFGETPIAAGSVAQVHRAVLRANGEDVAVKVRRPDIRRKMALDRAILSFGARVLERLAPSLRMLSIEATVVEFCAAVEQQLDFVREAENIARFRSFATAWKMDDVIVIPIAFPAASSPAVLTMEWVEGLREHELPGSGVDISQLIRAVVRGVWRSVFSAGFVHADPHPGNSRFLPPNRVVMMDFGLVAELDPDERRDFARLWFALATGDGAALAKIFYDQAPRRDVRDYRAYEAELAAYASAIHRLSLRELDTVRDVSRMFDILRRHRVQVRANFTMVWVGILAMEGLSRRLAPDLVLFDEILPYAAEGLELLPRDPLLVTAAPRAATISAAEPEPISFGSGRYPIVRILGEGARKRVYVARDATLDREVALSVLKSAEAGGADVARMTLEARAMAGLGDHPRIVAVHDFGLEHGRPYFVSELMAGGTVEELIERSGALPVSEALRIAGDVCQALAHAHGRGLVHSDVKPANVWLAGDGTAKLGDFGLTTSPDRTPPTPHSAIVGTVTYMAPEQALGKAVEARSDLYSLGCLLHEMLTGEPPFAGDAAAVLAHHLSTPPSPPSAKNRDVPAAVDALVARCLAKRVEDRPENAADLERALAQIVAGAAGAMEAAAAPAGAGPFVGREQELRQLVAAFEDSTRGRGRISMLAGEPGIGKTRTANEVAVHARRRGACVLLGRCHEGEGAPAFWPWVQILRAYVLARDAKALVVEAGLAAPVIAQLVPELRERIPGIEAPDRREGDEARFALFDGITRFLKTAARAQPLLLVLDDLHWADKPSLLLLEFLARELDDTRILVVATYRDVEVQRGHPLAEVLPSLRRASGHERIRLRGLREPDVRALIASRSGREISPQVARTIHCETEGNPFFVGEVVSHLLEEGDLERASDELRVPESIRDVISRRLERLSEATRHALDVASVIGREFDVAVLERVANGAAATLDATLAEAAAAGVIGEVPKTEGRFRFSHALVRETLYEGLRTAQRLALHKKSAEALESVRPDALFELAYHYTEAAPLGEIDKAVGFALRAAEWAAAQLAFESAVRHYEQALECAGQRPRPNDEERCELFLRLGEARFIAGESDRARTSLFEAARLAEATGDAERLGRAAFGFAGGVSITFDTGSTDPVLISLLEKALTALEGSASAIHARVMARYAGTLASRHWLTGTERTREEQARIETIAREAIAMARRTNDRETLALALASGAWWILSPDTLEERLELLGEAIAVAREMQNPWLEATARMLRAAFRCELGDMDAAAADEAAAAGLQMTRAPWLRWARICLSGARALLEGRLEDAEARIVEGLALGEQSSNRNAISMAYTQFLALRFAQGRGWDELSSLFSSALRFAGEAGNFADGFDLALSIVERDASVAKPSTKERLAELIRKTISSVGYGPFWMVEVCFCAEIAALEEDRSAAESLYETLRPFAARQVTLGNGLFLGAAARPLGVLATTLGRYDQAEEHFLRALAMNRRMRARPMVAYTQYNYAGMLLRRNASEDREKASALLGEAIETAQQIGANRLVGWAIARRLEAQGVASGDIKGSIDAVASSVENRRPDLATHAAPDGTVTLLFSDVEGFTAMTERLGDRRAHEVMREHNEIVRAALAQHGGHEVELLGDGFLLAFSSARRGLDCAVAIQKRFAEYNEAHAEHPLQVRMGLHTGEAIRDAHKFFGRAVILAARIAAHARGGEILVSSLLRDLVAGGSELPFGPVREVELKGLAGTHAICAVGWDGCVPEFVPTTAPITLSSSMNTFRRSGDYWTMEFDGRSITMRDMKGLRYIARLLAEPGREVHAIDLVGEGAADLGSAGEVLDPRARAEYRARLDDLKSELEDAEATNDTSRAARLREEMDFLSQELASAFGIGGRARRVADNVERARKGASGRINESLARIRKEHPALALHLANALRLGTFCEYHPERPTTWLL